MADEKDKKKDAEKKGDKDEASAAAAAAPAPAGKKKMILIGAGVVGLLLLIGVPVMIFSLKPKSEDPNELASNAAQEHGPALVAEGSHDEEELVEGEESVGAFFPFENFVVNLSGGRYIRAQIQAEFNGKDVPKRFYARLVPVRDSIITMLTSRAPDDLLSDKGKDALKEDIKDMINELLKKEEVKKIYFTQFFIQ